MKLYKAQNWTISIFIFLLIFTTVGGLSLFNTVNVFSAFISLYGTHLAVMLTFYFTQSKAKLQSEEVKPFKFGLIITLIVLWNAIIVGISIYTAPDFDYFKELIEVFPEWAGFIIAGAIVWLYSGKKTIPDPNPVT